MSDWTRGYDIDFLKECAALFRTEFKPHSYGAFGLPKERDVADAMAGDELMWCRKEKRGPVEAVAFARILKRPSVHEDFAGRRLKMGAGSVFVRAIAGSDEGKRRLLARCANVGPALFIEAHPEIYGDLIATSGADSAARLMTKISASSDLKGIYHGPLGAPRPDLEAQHPADEPSVKRLCPDFITEAERAEILAEIDAYCGEARKEGFAQHYSGYNKRSSWTAFALSGYDPDDPGFIIKPSEMRRKWKDENPARLAAACGPTTAAALFPATGRIIERIPGYFQRVRFMRLAGAGGELTRHADITDPEAGTRDGCVARLHIPIRTNEACAFRSWGLDGREHRLHMPERGLSYIDTRKPHAVVNPAEVERIHLVVDVFSGPEIRRMIAA